MKFTVISPPISVNVISYELDSVSTLFFIVGGEESQQNDVNNKEKIVCSQFRQKKWCLVISKENF